MSIYSYKVVRASNATDLSTLVQAIIDVDSDWQPYGAVVRDGRNLVQTLIQGEPEGSGGGGGGGGGGLTASAAGEALINQPDTAQMRNYLSAVPYGEEGVDDAVDVTDIVLRFNELLTQLRSSNVIAPPGDG